jgi:glycosyltransferase involved in cell wall biosynthesis
MKKYPVSILIPTLNEEKNLRYLLPTLDWAAEVIVLDSFSQDDSMALTNSYGYRFIQRTYDNPASQKNFGIKEANYDWVVLLDADERPDDQMVKHIQEIVSTDLSANTPVAWNAFRIQWFLGKEIKYSGWQNDWITRLIHRSSCIYIPGHVHEKINTSGRPTGQLRGKLAHYTCPDLMFFVQKIDRYARMSAIDHDRKTGNITYFHLWIKPAFRFFKHYILKAGFLDGYRGFIISKLMASGVFMRYAYLKEIRGEK